MTVRLFRLGSALAPLSILLAACGAAVAPGQAQRLDTRDIATPLPVGVSVMGTEAWPDSPPTAVAVMPEGLRGEVFGLTAIDHPPSEVQVRWRDDRLDIRVFVDDPEFSVMTGVKIRLDDEDPLYTEDVPLALPTNVTLGLRERDEAREEGGYEVGAVTCAGEGPGRSYTAEDGPDDLELNFGAAYEGFVPVDFALTYWTRYGRGPEAELRPELLEGRLRIPLEP
ncbi:MAG: hypothetical protein AAFU79_23545 [Myxococcota bacterium]